MNYSINYESCFSKYQTASLLTSGESKMVAKVLSTLVNCSRYYEASEGINSNEV